MQQLPSSIRNYLRSHNVRKPDYWFVDGDLTKMTWNIPRYNLSFSFDADNTDLLHTDKEFNIGGDDYVIM